MTRKVYYIAQESDTGDECTHQHYVAYDAQKCCNHRNAHTNTTTWYVVKVTQTTSKE